MTPPRAPRSLTLWLPALVAVAFLLAAIPFLDEFGPTWDTAIGEFAHGEQYLAFATSGDARYLDFTDAGPRPTHRAPHPAFDRGLNSWKDAFPLGGIVSAISCRVLWTKLGWLDAMPAHDLPILLFCAALLFAMTRFALPRFGALATFSALGLLLSSPRFLADQFDNLKDAPETCLYFLVLLAAYRAFATGSSRAMVAAGALTGLALAQKVNGLLLPPHVALLWIALAVTRRSRGEREPTIPWRGVVVAIPVLVACFLAVSPMTWSDPVGRILEHFRYYTSLGFRHWIPRFPGWLAFVSTTPLPLLALAPIGLFARRARADERVFLACGAFVPLFRVSLPQADNFDGVRHFLEFYPFVALLGGLGVAGVADAVARWLPDRRAVSRCVAAAIVALAVAPGAVAVVRTWPYGTVYFNALLGGLGGAQERGILDATDYWGDSYWEALDRVRREAPKNCSLLVPIAPHVARAAAPVRLGERLGADVWFDPAHAIPVDRNGPIVAFWITRTLAENDIVSWIESHATPWFEIRRDGGVLLKAFRVDDPARIAELKALDAGRFQLGVAVDRVYRQLARLPREQVDQWIAHIAKNTPEDLATVEAEMRAALPDWLRPDLDVLFPALPEILGRLSEKPKGR